MTPVSRRPLRALLPLLLLLLLLGLPAAAAERLPVVASFSILADMVAQVGGDRVAVRPLVGPDGDAHVYQPTPADAEAVARAGLVVVNGLGFDGWVDRLAAAAGYAGPVAVATEGVVPLAFDEEEAGGHDHDHGHDDHAHDHAHDDGHDHADAEHAHDDHAHDAHDDHAGHDHGPLDPHAWQDLGNARIYVANIARALSAADPAGAAVYAANAAAYDARIAAAEAEIRALLAPLPPERRIVVTSHDALGYFARAYGLRIEAPQGLSTESEASAAAMGGLIRQIRAEHIPAVFLENISDPRLLERIAAETGARIGGTLHSDALSGPGGGAEDYLEMMTGNARTIAAALAP